MTFFQITIILVEQITAEFFYNSGRITTRILLTKAAFRMRSQTARNKTLVMIKSRRNLCRRTTKIKIASIVILLALGILLASLLIPCK